MEYRLKKTPTEYNHSCFLSKSYMSEMYVMRIQLFLSLLLCPICCFSEISLQHHSNISWALTVSTVLSLTSGLRRTKLKNTTLSSRIRKSTLITSYLLLLILIVQFILLASDVDNIYIYIYIVVRDA